MVQQQERHLLKTNDIHHVWNHGPKHGGGFHCRYCNMKNSGGGATRFKEHLGKIVGEVKECPNVPRNVHDIMRKAVLEMRKKKREKESRKLRFERELMDEMYQRNGVINIDDDKDEEIHMALRESLRDRNVSRAVERRRGSGSGVRVSLGKQSITAYFDKQLSSNKVSMQPKISTAMDSSSRDAVGQAWAKFFHANDIAGRKADCPYFQAAMKITQNLGAAPIPTGKEIDGKYLDKNYEESREWLKLFKQDWKNYGVTVMCDSWTGPTGMSLINFMVYCNTRMFFHKSIDASGQSQNSEFLYREIKQVVVEEIGHENVVQIVTDNGSNYKKACKTLVEQPEFSHIVWQPCAAHTVNLMLKDIGKFPEVDVIVKSAKQICRFFYNHNNLHDSMRKNVGGELIKPNATRFGTVFMFLESYLEKKDKFRKWMVSDDWKNSIWKNDADHVFAEDLLSSNMWWTALEWVLDLLEPLYVALRYADTQKKCTLSGFKKTMMTAIQKMSSHLGGGSQMLDRVMSKVSPRMEDMQNETLMVAAAVLDPFTHYRVNLSNLPEYASALTDAIEKIADPESALLAINEISTYRECRGRFRHSLARSSAERMAPTEWWFQFGGEVPNLQKWALRIVSQCVSSSGCERNWTAFALVHTKQRNRLLYCKLHKSVSVRYNLKLRAEEDEDIVKLSYREKEIDPCAVMMDTVMHDESNPMMEWLNEDEEHIVLDGSDAATAVLEEIRRLNSRRKASHLGRKEISRKGKRVREDEEDEFISSEDDDEANGSMDIDDGDDGQEEDDESDGEGLPRQAEKDARSQVNDIEVTRDENMVNRRSGRQAKKVKDVNSLYY
ncbi:uncharacterized protein [Triticum aestivum]|uniref:uncharacterized protein isoform X2 n=1 Tax=Triticum aestivum TaxID=4565 RepID=UPI001D0082FD|nr:uncharacterized protein LOC123110480 isoform X2 [Triticum aestivum]